MGIGIRRSFRLKIALLAALICGSVLTTFGIALWRHVRRDKIDRLDRVIAGIASNHLAHFLSGRDRDRTPFPQSFYGEEFDDVAVWVKGEGGADYHSPNWPDELTAADLPSWPDSADPQNSAACQGLLADGSECHHQSCPVRPAIYRSICRDGRCWRLAGVRRGSVRMYAVLDLAGFSAVLRRTDAHFMITLPLGLLAAAVGGWWLARRAVRPVEELTRVAAQVTVSSLSRRIPETTQDREFARLTRVFNEMLARLSRSFTQAARFSADASHELRTPLAIMQGEVETALREVPPDSAAERALTTQLEEIHRLKRLVNRLLLLSRADRGALLSRPRPFDLGEIVHRAAEDAATLGENLTCTHEAVDGIRVVGDADLVEQALQNLVMNAVKHNLPGGSVRVTLALDGDDALVRVTNTGPEIAPVDRERIFDRFFRADSARSRHAGGVGLGLSLAREIARAHGGDLALEQSAEGLNTFALRLRAAPTEAGAAG